MFLLSPAGYLRRYCGFTIGVPKKKTQDVSTPVSRAGENAREPSSLNMPRVLRGNSNIEIGLKRDI
jgi:hypothetical protein